MNLWLVNNTQYVIADGIAGAAFLANTLKGETITLIKRNVVNKFEPRLISTDEALELMLDKT